MAVNDAQALQQARIEEARLLLTLATDFRRDGWADKSRRFARRALFIFEQEERGNPLDLVRALLCLAGAREDVLDHARAEADYQRASNILNQLADTPDARVLRIQTIRGLASVLLAMDQDGRAEAMLKDALALADEVLDSTHIQTATALDDLAVLCRHGGRLEEASRLHAQALAITEAGLGPEHPHMATILHHLGILEHARGRFAEGEVFARRSAAIRQKTLGRDHPQVAAVLASLAALLDGQGKPFEAKQLQRRAQLIQRRWFGPNFNAAVKVGPPTQAPVSLVPVQERRLAERRRA
jgi:tetratricopeptide (TPR) repeat protein